MAIKKKLPVDVNKRAKSIVDIATGEDAPAPVDAVKQAASILGKLGAKKGGEARAASLTPQKRTAIAKKAAKVRWNKKD